MVPDKVWRPLQSKKSQVLIAICELSPLQKKVQKMSTLISKKT